MYADVELCLWAATMMRWGGMLGNYSGFRGCHWHYHPTIGDSVAEASRYGEAAPWQFGDSLKKNRDERQWAPRPLR
jgi:hypothetical protein